MINVEIRPRTDAKVDIYITDGDNGEALLNSSQGYENHEDAEDLVRRLIGTRQCDDDPVILTVRYRNGTERTERIR